MRLGQLRPRVVILLDPERRKRAARERKRVRTPEERARRAAKCREWRQKNPDKVKRGQRSYVERNLALVRAKRAAYQKKNRAILSAKAKARREKRDREAYNARQRAYYQANKWRWKEMYTPARVQRERELRVAA